MDLLTYISDPARKAGLAKATGADPLWLWQIATAWRDKRPSPKLAIRIDEATRGVVSRQSLRPDIFGVEDKIQVA